MMKYNNGSTTIEFALGGIFLILCTFMVLEMAYRIHVNNAVEYALREAVRATLVHEGEGSYSSYNQTLSNIKNADSTLWSFLTPSENITVTGRYFTSYEALIGSSSFTDAELVVSDDGYQLAEVTMSYVYEPVLTLLGLQDDPITISRTMLFTLEHEGWDEQ